MVKCDHKRFSGSGECWNCGLPAQRIVRKLVEERNKLKTSLDRIAEIVGEDMDWITGKVDIDNERREIKELCNYENFPGK